MIPLAVHSHHSLMWGTASWMKICRRARHLGYTGLAMADTDSLSGLWQFLEACRCHDLRPIIGATLTDPRTAGHRVVCLAMDENGYTNLCRLLTRRHRQAGFCLPDELAAGGKRLYLLTTDPDLLARLHTAGLKVAAMTERPLTAGHSLRRMAAALEVPLVAAAETFFPEAEDHLLHRLLRAIDCRGCLQRPETRQVASSRAWLAAPDDWERRFAGLPQALAASDMIAEQISFRGPDFGLVMPPWNDRDSRTAHRVLRQAAFAGARRRYGNRLPPAVVQRLQHELEIIAGMKFSSCFLVVRDIVAHSPRTCGRGSAAASLVAYCLGITNVCPLRHNLYFGRFLNPGRKDPPDIDVDFAWDERDRVIAAVLGQYGNRAAMVSSRIVFQPRMAIRETARAFGLPDAEIGKVTGRLPRFRRSYFAESRLPEALREEGQWRGPALGRTWDRILNLAWRLIGTPRHLAVHPGGVVLTPRAVSDYVPVQTAAKGVPMIQWDKDDAEEAGLVKIDLLGNRSLAVIRDTVANLKANGKKFAENRWRPEEDQATAGAIATGRTMGCFYIESPAMRLLLQKAGRGDFEHLVALSSIIRPAANEFVRRYLRRLHGEPWQPVHPLLEKVLAETFGVMVYQEDVARVARALAGFTDAEADALRKIMARKDRRRHLADFRQRFWAGARTGQVAEDVIGRVWEMMLSFSGYSFCKAHSASYARVSFQAAFLKVHHPAEFMAAVITNGGGFYTTAAYVSEARRMGLAVAAPDVNSSVAAWTGRGMTLQAGLATVRGLAAETCGRILAARQERPFSHLEDFLERTNPSESEARALADAGALDSLAPGQDRAVIFWRLARWLQKRKNSSGQLRLFGTAARQPVRVPRLPPDDPLNLYRRQFAVLGFLCDRHPISFFRKRLERFRPIAACRLADYTGRRVNLAGWLVTGKLVRTKGGDPMQFLSFEDETGLFETVFFPKTYARFSHMLDCARPYLLTGRVRQDMKAVCLEVERIARLGRQ